MKSRLDKIEKEFSQVNNELTIKSAQLQQYIEEREEFNRRTMDLQQALELVKMDKVYLSKEFDAMKSRVMQLDDKVERQKKKIKDVKKVKEELFQQVLKAREEQKTNYESRLQVTEGVSYW